MKETVTVLVLIIIVTAGLFFISRNTNNLTDGFARLTGFLALTFKPELSLRDTSIQFHFEEPCFVAISGSIENKGNADAKDIIINCFIEDKHKNPLGAEAEYIGDLKKGSVDNFLIKINTRCVKDIPVYDCKAECSNC